MEASSHSLRPVRWIGSSRKDLQALPKPARQKIGFALYLAQHGTKHESAKPLKGYKGAGVVEVVADHDRNTYRAAYTVRFAEAVYVLHVFQKKSTRRIATSKRDLELIGARLRLAKARHQVELKGEK